MQRFGDGEKLESIDVSTLDLFFEIVPVENEMREDHVDLFDGSNETTYITDNLDSDSDCEWEDDDGNIFDVFNIEVDQ